MQKIITKAVKYGVVAALLILYIRYIAPWLHAQHAAIWFSAYVIVIVGFYWRSRRSLWAVRGNMAYINSQFELSRIYLERAVKANVKSSMAYLYYAILLLREGEATDDAFMALEKAMKLKKNVLEERQILTTLGTCYWISGQVDKGIETLEDLRQTHDFVNESVLTTLGYMYILKSDFDRAIELTNAAIELSPQYAPAWDNLGQAYYKQGKIKEAKDNFLKALSFKDGLADSNYFLGKIYEDEGELPLALAQYKKAAICNITAFNTIGADEVDEALKRLEQASSDS